MALHLSKKKLKYLQQLKKNRMLQEIFNLMRLRRQEDDRVKTQEKQHQEKPRVLEKSEESEVHDKMAVIRNRLTDKKRTSRERWNRFAGTSGGGGRGL